MDAFLEQVKKTITKYQMLDQGDKVLVGVSGGPDSLALLHILKGLQRAYSLELFVVHLNHMFRGEEAAREAQYVATLAKEWNIPYQIFTEDVQAFATQEGLSAQDAGHKIRKRIFKKLKEEKGFTKLALGHHGDDRVETLLIHLLHGTGLEGLAAMPPKKGWLIRPLAEVGKQEIINYCQKNNLRFCVDPSNSKEIYLRNKVRLNLLPYLEKEFNPNIMQNLLKFKSIVEEDNEYITDQVKKILVRTLKSSHEGKIVVDLEILQREPLAIQRRIIREVYSLLRPESQGLAFNHVEQVLDLASFKRGSKKMDLPFNVKVQKGYTTLEFIDNNYSSPARKEFNYQWQIPGELSIKECDLVVKAYFIENKSIETQGFSKVIVDGDKVPPVLEVSPRVAGDRIQPLGMKGTKKLKDFLIDRKVPREMRDNIPVIRAGEDIIWLPSVTISEKIKVTSETKNYLILEVKKQ